ncbi:MAG: peptidoglycan DD-metalloendopeptidase family protein [Methyloprofundus sp.]|nr:peptidoglycan DD-metalloendopeptidase family protein [Methyloprofundus sp.]
MRRSVSRLAFILIALMITAGCANSPSKTSTTIKKRNLSSSSYYTVKKGDNLSSVGFRSGHGYKQLAKWNNIAPPYTIFPGQKLKLFSGKKSRKAPKKKKHKKNSSKISTINKKVLRLHWNWPVKGQILRGFYATGNKGIDIAGSVGQKIKAARSGIVVYSGSGLAGYGKLLIIKHNYLYLSAYAHNRRLLVKEGQKVKKGQSIAEMGVGVNAKPSLHFEIRKNGKPVNPLNYLSK